MAARAAQPERTELSRAILIGAIALAALADATLRATPWGLNGALWAAALAGTAATLAWWRRDAFAGASAWLAAPVVVAAVGVAWRDSSVLVALDLLLLVVALAGLRGPVGRPDAAGLAAYAAAVGVAVLDAWVTAATLLAEHRLRLDTRAGPVRHAPAVLRGLLLAAPLLLLFGGLLVAADAVFERLTVRALGLDLGSSVRHVAVVAALAWAIGGYLRGVALGGAADPAVRPAPPARLGAVEAAVVLGLLDLLFLAFVLVQVRYLFGGAARVEASTGLTYAEYARRGFFELCAVAGPVLPLLLLLHWQMAGEGRAGRMVFRALAGMQVALLFVIMASAVQCMRLYTTAFMVWLAVVFLWFLVTVLRDRRERFAAGLLASGILAIALLHAVNPDAFIARTNAARTAEGRRFDAAYVAGLTTEAVPALVAALPRLSPGDRCRVAVALRVRWSGDDDWQTWNWGRSRGRHAVATDLPERAAGCCGEAGTRRPNGTGPTRPAVRFSTARDIKALIGHPGHS